MSDFQFHDPEFVHLLWAVAALMALLFVLERRGGTVLGGLVGPALQDRLVERPRPWRRYLRIAFVGLAAACAVLALMRPQWGMRVVAASRVGAEIMIALDVSRSMLAEDVAPNRLERAKAEIVDLLSYMDGDQVGLIAFAGRASVLSPLTPDFGFLRLVLEETGPGSVTRGGTKLAEPIQKAVNGFGPSEGASRAILLITDGEDHDSFAVDAARKAAEAGIKIIAIGFGDEGGTEIRITDPRTGARGALRDAGGDVVRSALNGDLLRELALATDGAYVPAGTGVLDLESIYDEHIARLIRGKLDGTRTVRDEGYPWFVLLSVIFLVSSAVVSGGRLRGAVAAAVGVVLLASVPAQTTRAQQPAQDPLVPPGATLPADPESEEETPTASAPVEREVEPRSIYNQGVEALAGHDFEESEQLLSRARRDARGDDELRFHASYNLGWVGVQQAGRKRGDAPKEALQHLYRASDWFREAVRLRPENEAARHNLEVTLKQTLVLADELARNAEGGVEGALSELIARQRKVVAGVAGLLEAAHRAGDAAGPLDEALRAAFRVQATAERAVLADADQLAAQVGAERDGIEARPEEERTPEDSMRAAQLDNVGGYLHRARERMGQARRQLRQRQADRAYRRTSGALSELKRALDQLRDPVRVLDQLLSDGAEIARGTALLSLAGRDVPGLADALPEIPPWLTARGLAEDQTTLAERASELQMRFAAGITQADAADPASIPPEQQSMLDAVREAEPLVRSGSEYASQAAVALDSDALEDAPPLQAQALTNLADARERFLDIRGLIEATYGEEERISQVVNADALPEGQERDEALAGRAEFAPVLRAAQERNLGRGARLEAKLGERAAQLAALTAAVEEGTLDPDAEPPDPEQLAQETEHLEIATKILALAVGGMEGVRDGLASEDSIDWDWVESDAATALEHLETLRRLFFSIAEHLRDVAQRQVELADRTQDALALSAAPDIDPNAEAAPLVDPEKALAEQTLVIANVLEQQSTEAGADPQAEEDAARLREAAEHVLLAQGEMEGATGFLSAPADLEAARGAQDLAIAELAKALEVLEPPQQQGDEPGESGEQEQQQQEQQQQEQQQADAQDESGGEGQPEPQPSEEDPQGQTGVDPGQLLQEVREREAQRRRDRAEKQAGYETVEKDW